MPFDDLLPLPSQYSVLNPEATEAKASIWDYWCGCAGMFCVKNGHRDYLGHLKEDGGIIEL